MPRPPDRTETFPDDDRRSFLSILGSVVTRDVLVIQTRPAELFPWSSYRKFAVGPCVADWVATERALEFFRSPDSIAMAAEKRKYSGSDPF